MQALSGGPSAIGPPAEAEDEGAKKTLDMRERVERTLAGKGEGGGRGG